jgi:hypothetical protein
MYVEAIAKVKKIFEQLKADGTIDQWELPYENILTRLDAAIFFADFTHEEAKQTLAKAFGDYEEYKIEPNKKKLLSQMPYTITFGDYNRNG